MFKYIDIESIIKNLENITRNKKIKIKIGIYILVNLTTMMFLHSYIRSNNLLNRMMYFLNYFIYDALLIALD
jgi:hypothetical protein